MTNLWKMTREQHEDVNIRLNFSDYSEVFTAYELMADGSFTIEVLQACCDLDGKEYTPKNQDDTDVETIQVVPYESIEDADDYDSDEDDESWHRSWQMEIAREAGAMYGMQAYHDHLGYDVEFNPEEER